MPEPRSYPRADGRAIAALLAVQVCFGTFPVFGKIALAETPPMVLAAMRAIAGAIVLTLLARVLAPEERAPDARDRRMLLVLSLFGIVANQTLFVSGLARTTATNATLCTAATPVFTMLIAALSGRDRPSLRRMLGVPIALAGLLTLLDVTHIDFSDRTLVGNLLILSNALSYSIFLVLSRDVLARRSAASVTAAIFRYAALPILLLAVPDLRTFRPDALTGRAWIGIAGVILLSTIVAYALNTWALARMTATTVAMFMYVQPLVAISLARAVLGERPSPQTAVAAALIFAGVALTTWPQSLTVRRPPPR